jgi:hypothetical protein
MQAVGRGDVASLFLLNLLAAFRTVDRDVLLLQQKASFGTVDAARRWFQSRLFDRSQYARRWPTKPSSTRLVCGVAQGSGRGL